MLKDKNEKKTTWIFLENKKYEKQNETNQVNQKQND